MESKSKGKSEEKRKPDEKTKSTNKKTKQGRKKRPKSDVDGEAGEPARTPTLTGRPPGKKDGKGPLKKRATLWLPVELIDAYRDRVWEERCQIGELFERALEEYRQRHWGEKSDETSA